jgi:uncharacterized protein DUF4190/uncharacterized protein DUF1707
MDAVSLQPPDDLRASDADRDAAAARVRVAATEGRLDSDELDGRLQAIYSARWCTELTRLTADITPRPGATAPPVFVKDERPTNGFAVASLVLGILWLGWLGSVLAVAFGHVALRQIGREPDKGRNLAIAGLILGYVGMLTLTAAIVVDILD